MGQDSKIEWTHHTFNPWWGCVKVSPGCSHCYAETFSKRTGNEVWGAGASRRFFGDKHWNEPLKWNAAAKAAGERRRVFCASMADWLESGRTDLVEPRVTLLELVHSTPDLDWLLLSKRPQNWQELMVEALQFAWANSDTSSERQMDFLNWLGAWVHAHIAPHNVWIGTTAEDQARWDERMPVLAAIPARLRFVSAEPLLGPIHMGEHRPDWLIVGGESGPKARPMESAWVDDLLWQCDYRTAFFFKQWGGVHKKETGRELQGRTFDALPSVNV